MTIHWCGTGLSAIPGLRRLIEAGQEVTVWNRTLDKAQDAVGDLTPRIHIFDMDALRAELQTGDVIVSMLPGDFHVPLAELAISAGAHFASSSYIAPEMRALDAKAKDAGVVLLNEIGLDPGIDHLMAHHLVEDYRNSDARDDSADLSFISYCGGIPKHPNPFRYKFSWSPLGVLKALRSPSKSIRDFAELSRVPGMRLATTWPRLKPRKALKFIQTATLFRSWRSTILILVGKSKSSCAAQCG